MGVGVGEALVIGVILTPLVVPRLVVWLVPPRWSRLANRAGAVLATLTAGVLTFTIYQVSRTAEPARWMLALLLASGLLLLGWLHSDTLLYATSFGLGFALVQVTGLAGGSATLAAPDTHRARITALVVALFEIGGECGSTLLHPIVAQHGLGRALTALAAILLILALPALLRPRDRLPRWMTLA